MPSSEKGWRRGRSRDGGEDPRRGNEFNSFPRSASNPKIWGSGCGDEWNGECPPEPVVVTEVREDDSLVFVCKMLRSSPPLSSCARAEDGRASGKHPVDVN